LLLVTALFCSFGQSASTPVEFEVAAVHKSPMPSQGAMPILGVTNSRLEIMNYALIQWIACGESVLAAAESKRVSAAMLEFNKQVNASIVDPGFIARVRKKLALDQRQAAAIFGGGANAFSRYENGKTKPPLALVKLLMVLDRHPHLLNEVRAGR
jgi:HTH-type transcriptional regulator/antitoxin MqsA